MFVQQVGATCDRVSRSSRLNASPSWSTVKRSCHVRSAMRGRLHGRGRQERVDRGRRRIGQHRSDANAATVEHLLHLVTNSTPLRDPRPLMAADAAQFTELAGGGEAGPPRPELCTDRRKPTPVADIGLAAVQLTWRAFSKRASMPASVSASHGLANRPRSLPWPPRRPRDPSTGRSARSDRPPARRTYVFRKTGARPFPRTVVQSP